MTDWLRIMAAAALISTACCTFNLHANDNTVVYYGQGPNQKELLYLCQQPSIDIIVLSFVDLFPAQADGYPGTNFGNQCSGAVFPGPGYRGVVHHALDELQASCPALSRDIPICQAVYGKKLILSLGGGVLTYQLDGAADGVTLAQQLFYMFGPRNLAWVAKNLPRPFDSPGRPVEIDGFDLDIERAPTDQSKGYIAMASRLRQLFRFSSKKYLLTGSPQCIVPDANMGAVIAAVQFDLLFIQFYNTAACSASSWAGAAGVAPRTATTGQFSFDDWSAWLSTTNSRSARLFIGLPGSPTAANPGFYVSTLDAARLIDSFACHPAFGGVSIWDATYADSNVQAGQPFYANLKQVLEDAPACGTQ